MVIRAHYSDVLHITDDYWSEIRTVWMTPWEELCRISTHLRAFILLAVAEVTKAFFLMSCWLIGDACSLWCWWGRKWLPLALALEIEPSKYQQVKADSHHWVRFYSRFLPVASLVCGMRWLLLAVAALQINNLVGWLIERTLMVPPLWRRS